MKIKIIRENYIYEDLLDEAKEDDAYEDYWKHHENDFRRILSWIYGKAMPTYQPPTFTKLAKPWQMMARAKGPMKDSFAPERSKRIKYLNWMTKMHKGGDSPRKIIDAVELFLKFSSQMKEKSINKYESADHVVSAYKKDVVHPRVAKARKERGGREGKFVGEEERDFIYKDDHIEVVRPYTLNASCEYGKKTKWCISQQGNEYFDKYTNQDAKIFYFILDDRRKNNDKYHKVTIQLTIDNNENIIGEGFWDRYDNDHMTAPATPIPIQQLYDNNVYRKETLDAIMAAIEEHSKENPPEHSEGAKLAKLDEEIWGNKHDNQFVSFRSQIIHEPETLPRIEIYSTLEFQFKVPMFEKHEDNNDFIIESWENALENGMEGTLAEYIGNDSDNDFEYSGFYEEVRDLEDHLWKLPGSWMKVRLPLIKESFGSHHYAASYLDDVINHYSTEQVDRAKATLVGIIHNYMKHELNPEGKIGIENLAKKIWSLNSQFRHIVGRYEEGDVKEETEPTIHFVQKKGFVIPLKIPVHNKPVRGYDANLKLNGHVKEFLKVVRMLVVDRLERAVIGAVSGVHSSAVKTAEKQMRIDFPNYGVPEEIKTSSYKPTVDVYIGTPSVREVRGEADQKSPAIDVEVAMMVTAENDPNDILWSVEYMKFIDDHLEEIYDLALRNFNTERIQRKINIVFRDKVLHKDEEYLKRKGLSLNERKIKVNIK